MSDVPPQQQPGSDLLQIIAHDLLAPLTAVKWQLELLAHPSVTAEKARRYREGMQSSVELGIVLAKNAYLAGKVLQHSCALDLTPCSLGATVRAAAETVRLQFERHGLALETAVADEPRERTMDAQFVSFYVWVVTKFFLTCTSTGGVVRVEGAQRATDGAYRLQVSAMTVPNADTYGRVLREDRDVTALDQSALFAWLLRTTAPVLGISFTVDAHDTTLSVESTFQMERA